jgi:hypothetical protein
MHRTLLVLAVLALAFAPAPLPRPDRRAAPQTMAGVWDVDWGGMPVRLTFRPDGSARFEYTKIQGTWDGSWKYDAGLRRVTLTLSFGPNSSGTYPLQFDSLGRDWAEGKILDSPSSSRPLKLKRSGGP